MRTPPLLRRLRRLRPDEQGATVVEFAIIAPVLGLLLLGAFDIAHSLYTRTVLQGIVQKTGRDATLESGLDAAQQTLLDTRVRNQVKALANNAEVTITRAHYRTFSNAAAAQFEPYTDTNRNGRCDNREPYEDNNNNERFDATGGNTGQGGAKDATLYTVTVTYPRFFPVQKMIGGSGTTTITGSTVLRNQPYGDQAPPTVRQCPLT